MKTEFLDPTAITSLSLDREVVRDLTPEEMNEANGGTATPGSVILTIASEATPVSVVVTIITVASYISWKTVHEK